MKIAFVGKGGTGKTTLTSLFIKYLNDKKNKIIAIDADINVGLADNLGIEINDDRFLSKSENTSKIREKLILNNNKIKSVNHFVKTTPPGNGSFIIDFSKQDFFHNFSSYENEYLKFFHVGTYRSDEIGVSCYHTHLSILENIISHTKLDINEYMVVDMVAGNDSFSNTLHSQFDVLFLIVEPIIESINMMKGFMKLANHSNETSKIVIIGNKIEDSDDLDFIKDNGINLDFYVPYNKNFKKNRRNGEIIVDDDLKLIFDNILDYLLENIKVDRNKKLSDLHNLHKKYLELDYIKLPLGDLSEQIDLDFNFDKC
ncbi:MAG: ATP-binding protein [Candidatus Gracilibacteria bacterium]|nr:ATP-binding protein [Candidatus Gracilibacteria bacterium]